MAKKFCTSCGAPLGETMCVCAQCGAEGNLPPQPAPVEASPVSPPVGSPEVSPQDAYSPAPPAAAVPVVAAAPAVSAPPRTRKTVQAPERQPRPKTAPKAQAPQESDRYDIITTGGWIGVMLLMAIPIVGVILMIVWACGGCKKQVKRNFARAGLILSAIALVLGLLISLGIRAFAPGILADLGLNALSGSESGSFSTSDLSGMSQPEESGMPLELSEQFDSDSGDTESADELAGLAALAGLMQGGDPSALASLEGQENQNPGAPESTENTDPTSPETSENADLSALEDLEGLGGDELNALAAIMGGLDLSALAGLAG